MEQSNLLTSLNCNTKDFNQFCLEQEFLCSNLEIVHSPDYVFDNVKVSSLLNIYKAIGIKQLYNCGLLVDNNNNIDDPPTTKSAKYGKRFGNFVRTNDIIYEVTLMEEEGPFLVIVEKGIIYIYPLREKSFILGKDTNITPKNDITVHYVEDNICYSPRSF
jgi:hypothetical protein